MGKNENILLTAILAILVVAAMVIFADRRSPEPALAGKMADDRLIQKINESRDSARLQMSIQQQETELENAEAAPEIESGESLRGHHDLDPIDLVPEDKNTAAYRATHPEDPRYDRESLPSQRIDQALEQRKFVHDYDQKLNEAYVSHFVENAKQDGVELKIENGVVVDGKIQRRRPSGH